MMRLGSPMAIVALGVGLSAGAAVADQNTAPKLVAPVRGEALVEITKPDTKPGAKEVVTTMLIRNASKSPIAGLKVDENWYKGNNAVGGDSYRHPRPLQPGEVIQVTLRVPRANIVGARNQYQFTHANGTVKVTTVPKLEPPKPPKPTS
jgi:hypothetical protein